MLGVGSSLADALRHLLDQVDDASRFDAFLWCIYDKATTSTTTEVEEIEKQLKIFYKTAADSAAGVRLAIRLSEHLLDATFLEPSVLRTACLPPHTGHIFFARSLLACVKNCPAELFQTLESTIARSIVAENGQASAKDFIARDVNDPIERFVSTQLHVKNPKRDQIQAALGALVGANAVLLACGREHTRVIRTSGGTLARVMCGSPDQDLRCTAARCLNAVLKSTENLASVVTDHLSAVTLEFRQSSEVGQCGAVLVASALISHGNLDRPRLATLLASVASLVNSTKSALVKSAFICEAGVFGKVETDPARLDLFVKQVTEPLMSSRKLSNNREDFANLARYIRTTEGVERCLGKQVANIDAVVGRAIILKPPPVEVWDVVAAIASTDARRAAALVPKVTVALSDQKLSPNLAEAIEALCANIPKETASNLRSKFHLLVQDAIQLANPAEAEVEVPRPKAAPATGGGIFDRLFDRIAAPVVSTATSVELTPKDRALLALSLVPSRAVAPLENSVAELNTTVVPLLDAVDVATAQAAITAITIRASQAALEPNVSQYYDPLRHVLSVALRRATNEPEPLARLKMFLSIQRAVMTRCSPADPGPPTAVLLQDKRSLTHLLGALHDHPQIRKVALSLLCAAIASPSTPAISSVVEPFAVEVMGRVAAAACALENTLSTGGSAIRAAAFGQYLVVGPKRLAPYLGVVLRATAAELARSSGKASQMIPFTVLARDFLSLYTSGDACLVANAEIIVKLAHATVGCIVSGSTTSELRTTVVTLLNTLLRSGSVPLLSLLTKEERTTVSQVLRKDLPASTSDMIVPIACCLGALHQVGDELVDADASAADAVVHRSLLLSLRHGVHNDTSTRGEEFEATIITLPTLLSVLDNMRNEAIISTSLSAIVGVIRSDVNQRRDTAHAVSALLQFATKCVESGAEVVTDALTACALALEHRLDASDSFINDAAVLLDAAWNPDAAYFAGVIDICVALRLTEQHESLINRSMPWIFGRLATAMINDTTPEARIGIVIARLFATQRRSTTEILSVVIPAYHSTLESRAGLALRCVVLTALVDTIVNLDAGYSVPQLLHTLRGMIADLDTLPMSALITKARHTIQTVLNNLSRHYVQYRAVIKPLLAAVQAASSDSSKSASMLEITDTPTTAAAGAFPATGLRAQFKWPAAMEKGADSAFFRNEITQTSHPEKTNVWDSDAWLKWFASFSKAAIVNSPQLCVRACSALAERYAPFRNIITPAAIMTHVREMHPSSRREVDAWVLSCLKSGCTEIVIAFLAYLDLSDVYHQDSLGGGTSTSPAATTEPTNRAPAALGKFGAKHNYTRLSDAFAAMSQGAGWSLSQPHASHNDSIASDLDHGVDGDDSQGPGATALLLSRTSHNIWARYPVDELVRIAHHASSHAHAVRIAEIACEVQPNPERFTALANCCNAVGLPEAALGHLSTPASSPLRYELLNDWSSAADAYMSPQFNEFGTHPHIRSLLLAARFEEVLAATRTKHVSAASFAGEFAEYTAIAATMLGRWDTLVEIEPQLTAKTPVSVVLRSVSALHRSAAVAKTDAIEASLNVARRFVASCIASGANEVTTMEAYLRCINDIDSVATAQRCGPESLQSLCRSFTVDPAWSHRAGSREPPLIMPLTLAVFRKVARPFQMADAWLGCARSLRSSHRDLARWLVRNLEDDCGDTATAEIKMGIAQFRWEDGDVNKAIFSMKDFLETHEAPWPPNKTWAQSNLLLSQWIRESNADFWREQHRDHVAKILDRALEYSGSDPVTDAAIWRSYALFYYRVQQYDHSITPLVRDTCVAKANVGMVNSICLKAPSITALPDTIRLLQLWSVHGANKDVAIGCVARLPVYCWALVAPQLVSQLNSPSEGVVQLALHALRRAVQHSIDAVVFPLVLTRGVGQDVPTSRNAQAAARNVLDTSSHQTVINDVIEMVKGLDAASSVVAERLHWALAKVLGIFECFEKITPEKTPAVSAALAPIIAEVAALPEYHVLDERLKRLEKHFIAGEKRMGWDLLLRILEGTEAELKRVRVTASKHAPRLRSAFNVVVPGEVDPLQPSENRVTILGLDDSIDIIASKHRPRRVTLTGTDGIKRRYLLKSQEDLRVDERVMQLFTVVNAALPVVDRMHTIVTYAVVPLLPTMGLIGWVEGADTVARSVSTYRDQNGIPVDMEVNKFNECYEYGHRFQLPKPCREEVFEWTLKNCPSTDIARVLWLKSRSSQLWLTNRTAYTKSTAFTCMVGYIVGLGDRHPGNLMLLEHSGRVAHIDFGDCFDKARLRSELPETVPFRLTQMTVNAMELAGTQGSFKTAAESALTLLRQSRDSIGGLLGALVHDPTFNALHEMPSDQTSEGLLEAIRGKLRGVDCSGTTIPFADRVKKRNMKEPMTVAQHVKALTMEAQSLSNLSELFHGWQPLW